MNAKIIFKNANNSDVVVKDLQEVYSGCAKVLAPYANLVMPGYALTFVGDITICCNSDDVLTVIID